MAITEFLPWSSGRRKVRKVARRSNKEWLEELRGPNRNQAIEDLRIVLVRGLRYGLKGKLGRGSGVLIEDFAQEALLKILEKLDTFRGESRFTTWAQKIAMRVAFSELRRKRWEDVSLDELLASDDTTNQTPTSLPDSSISPYEKTSQRMVTDLVTEIIQTELTERQRNAMIAIVIHGMPMEEVARKMGTNRNALYKLLHDARKRLQTVLKERGLEVEDVLSEL